LLFRNSARCSASFWASRESPPWFSELFMLKGEPRM
jgi:hypothetical protein